VPQKRRHRRIRRSFACELCIGDRRYRGMAVELSQSGLFVQTAAAIRPGSEIEIRLAGSGTVPGMALRAVVARRHIAPAQLATFVRRGVALEVLEAPVEYGLACGSEPLAAPIKLTRGK
jgi:hypothetical protein